jgi:arylsulfatase A-like enzyme
VLLARRLVEAGVSLVQVNWYRGPDEPPDNPCWDSHTNEVERLRTVLVPPMDQAFAALLGDLEQRGMLDETLVVCMAEFGRTPRFNNRGGRDHWGPVFSVALAGGGIRGGVAHGASDALGAQPADGRVQPQDLTATILHCLGIDPHTEIRDRLARPIPACTGEVIRQIL